MAGNQDALQLSGTTSVYVIGEEEGGGGSHRSSDVSHAAGPLRTRTAKEGLMGITTPTQGNQRDNNEGQREEKYAKDAEERLIRQQLQILDQMDIHAAATHAESIWKANAEARAEADRAHRVQMAANAQARRAKAEADRARAESDTVVAEKRLLLQLQLAALTNQPYPVDTPTQDQTNVNMARMIHSHDETVDQDQTNVNMARMIHSHDETVDQTTVLPKMEHIRGEKNLP